MDGAMSAYLRTVSSPWWNSTSPRERRGARLAGRDERAYRVYVSRAATQPAGMQRRSNAAGVSPRASLLGHSVNRKTMKVDARASSAGRLFRTRPAR